MNDDGEGNHPQEGEVFLQGRSAIGRIETQPSALHDVSEWQTDEGTEEGEGEEGHG